MALAKKFSLLLRVKTHRRWRATWIAHSHCKGFGWEIPLLNVERLYPETTPESARDPTRSAFHSFATTTRSNRGTRAWGGGGPHASKHPFYKRTLGRRRHAIICWMLPHLKRR